MNNPERTPENNHDGRSKRCRTDAGSPIESPSITRIIPPPFISPLVVSLANQSKANEPSEDQDVEPTSSNRGGLLLTQAPTVSAPPVVAAGAIAAGAADMGDAAAASSSSGTQQTASNSEVPDVMPPFSDEEELLLTQPPIVVAAAAVATTTAASPSGRPLTAYTEQDSDSECSDSDLSEDQTSQIIHTQPPSIAPTPASHGVDSFETTPHVYYAKTTHFQSLSDIPDCQKHIITEAIADLYPTIKSRDFQIEGINHLCFNDDPTLIMIRRTADGKSLVPLSTAFIRRGVSIMMVPLHGLGSDQVEKAISEEHAVEAYYVDEHRSTNAQALRSRLLHLTDDEASNVSILLFVSPMSLASDSSWLPEFQSLAKRGQISLLGIDEAHSVEQAGRSFRTEFVDAVKNLSDLTTLMLSPVPRLAMSATFREEDKKRLETFFGSDDVVVMEGPLDRRATLFSCIVSGNPAKTMIASAERDLKAHPDKQQLWYGNSRSNCEGAMLDRGDLMIEKFIRSKGGSAICHSFTGGDGVKIKCPVMDAFTSFASLPGEAIFHPDGSVTLPRILILTATSAANCGISSNDLTNVKHKGFPRDLYDLVQELGRANRTQDMPDCKYEIHCSFNCVISAYIRIMKNDNALERSKLLGSLLEVIKFMFVPAMCYHSFIERYFEWNEKEKINCGNMCSYCRGECAKFTGRIHRT